MTARLEAEEVLQLAWITARAMPNLPPEAAADVINIALEKAGYKIVPIDTTEGRECQSATKAT